MDFNITRRYAGIRDHGTHKYSGFHSGRIGTEMHGYKPEEIVEVELEVIDHAKDYNEKEVDEPEVYTGIYFFNKGESMFVYNHILSTKVCSPGFFKRDIEEGEAIFVKLKIKEI